MQAEEREHVVRRHVLQDAVRALTVTPWAVALAVIPAAMPST